MCVPLVEELVGQMKTILDIRYEIIVADDGSTDTAVVAANRAINSLPGAVYWELGRNVGRAAIRNRLYERSKGEWLLFLDSDGMPVGGEFIVRYIAEAKVNPGCVVCGGICHPAVLPSPEVSLRWRYEKSVERRFTTAWRVDHPYANFRSFNFLIPRRIFSSVLFDERLRCYGFEDNLFGERLRACGIPVLHIDNPMLNMDIEPNGVFLRKNEEAMRTIAEHYDTLAPLLRLSVVLKRLENVGMGWLLSVAYRLLRPLLLRNLLGSSPCIWVLNLYKAGYLRSLLLEKR